MLNVKKDTSNRNQSFIPTTDNLFMDDQYQERWLSHPDSRIVINPFNFDDASLWGRPQADYCNRPTLPLNIGYLDPWLKDSRGQEMKDAIIILEKTHEGKAAPVECWNAVYSGLSSINLSDGTSLYKEKEGFAITGGGDSEHDVFTADFRCELPADKKMVLVIHIGELRGKWSLKIHDGIREKVLRQETTTTGAFIFSLDQLDFQEENSGFDIILSMHGRQASGIIDDMRILKGNLTYTDSIVYGTSWQPHKLSFNGTFAGGLTVSGFDFLYGTKTVVRRIKWDGKGNPVIAGEYKGNILIEDNHISIICENYTYAVALNQKTCSFKFYKSLFELLSGAEPSLKPLPGYGFFMLELQPELSENEVTVALAIDTHLTSLKNIVLQAVKASMDPAVDESLLNIKQFWDDYLSKVPCPGDFEFRHIDAKDVTQDDIRLLYYAGWVLLKASLAPASPEVGFNYRQMTAGKPSLWGYGEPRAAYTAAWDSLYGIQLLAFVDSDAAWEAFTGIMSLVDKYGILAGESLPVMRARTAYILYNCKSDKSILKLNFENIERNLIWGIEHPYWIWMENNPLDSTLKDAAFTSSILVDIPYFIKLCRILGEQSKAEMWEQKYDEFYKDFLLWTFPHDGSLPTEYYNALREADDGSGSRSCGNTIWVTKCLHVEGLEKPYVDRLKELFLSEYDIGKSFCGFSFVKLEEISYTIYGLMENGFEDEACSLIEASVRDVVRSRFLGEIYTQDELPICFGVRPSLFGVVQLVGGIWLRNGFRFDTGFLTEHRLFDGPGFVKNVCINGTTQDFFHEL